MTIRSAHTRRLVKLMRQRGWNRDLGSIRRRLYDLASCHQPWWDWGHRLMIVTGSDDGGNWSEPEPPTWWYREAAPKRMWCTGYPRRRLHVVRDYKAFRAQTAHLDTESDDHYPWRAIGVNQDHDLYLGRMYWGGPFYGLNATEMRLLARWLIRWECINWFGARSWLHSLALHAAVYQRKPFSCAEVPPPSSGGYSHWLCREKRGHVGPHCYRNARWDESGLIQNEAQR